MAGLIAAAVEALEERAWLVPVSGPALPSLLLAPQSGGAGLFLGRADTAQLRLPLSADKVSRNHCRFVFRSGGWWITDQSKWGTFVNGVRLAPGTSFQLAEGDLVAIAPWTFELRSREPEPGPGESITDVDQGADIHNIALDPRAHPRTDSPTDPRRPGHLETPGMSSTVASHLSATGGELVELLLQAAELLYAARNETELAETLVDLAVRGTGLPNASLLKVVNAQGRVEPIAVRRATATPAGRHTPPKAASHETPQLYSRTLVERARLGQVAELRVDRLTGNIGESVMTMKISAAICAPISIGDGSQLADNLNISALLYLDTRLVAGVPATHAAPWAASFVMLLARIASLALSNLMRLDFARRLELSRRDLAVAAEAQQLILPPRAGSHGSLRYLGESRAGQSVGGDFFDVVRLPDGRMVVALGDVSGKGVSASVLMTATFGYLHALLETELPAGKELSDIARRLNDFLLPRRAEGRFVTLWLGVFDPHCRELCYLDCGHGLAGLLLPDGAYQPLDRAGGLPCGIADDPEFDCVRFSLPPGGQVVIVSDGIVEQFGPPAAAPSSDSPTAAPSSSLDQFGLTRLAATLRRSIQDSGPAAPADLVATLFTAVTAFAVQPLLTDDATAILVSWD